MNALILEEVHQPLVYKTTDKPKPAVGEVLLKMKAGALNHRDVYINQGLYPGIVVPIILGSDGCGEVAGIGQGVDADWLGQEVIINPSMNWGDNPAVQSLNYEILGMPKHGTFAEYLCVSAELIYKKPEHLSSEQAAALPLAALTAYRALFSKAGLKAREKVLISGVGGGVALFACQMAIAAGAEVYVTSGSQQKIEGAVSLGAKGGVNYKEEDWAKQLQKMTGGFDVIIDSAGGDGFKHFLNLANMGGRIAFYGGTRGSFKVSPQKMFWKQLSMFGSTMGTAEEFGKMVDFVNAHKLIPIVDSVWDLAQGNEAFAQMDAGKQFGKIVLKIS